MSSDPTSHAPDPRTGLVLPDRRSLLRTGGLALVGAVVLAACADDDEGAAPEDATTTSTTSPADVELDAEDEVALLRTAMSLELAVIDAYRGAIERGLVETGGMLEALAIFQAHHDAHHRTLAAIVDAAGGEPYRTPNAAIRAAIVDPALTHATGEADVVRLAHDLEVAATQLYVHAATRLRAAELRAASMSIGGVESRHVALLAQISPVAGERPSAYPAENPLPPVAMLPR
jgi:hypothetical protein